MTKSHAKILLEEIVEKNRHIFQEKNELYLNDPLVSLEKISQQLFAEQSLELDRKEIAYGFSFLDFPRRTREQVNESMSAIGNARRTELRSARKEKWVSILESNGGSLDLLISEYLGGESLISLARKYGLTQCATDILLVDSGVITRKAIMYWPKKLEILEAEARESGYTLEDKFREIYVTSGSTFEKAFAEFNSIFREKVSKKQFIEIRAHFGITQSEIQKKKNRGSKSRGELEEAFARLKKAGFRSREELAKYYANTRSLTKEKLLEEMNFRLEEVDRKFTMRWLGRHLDPFLPADYKTLCGTSRPELELLEFIKEFTPENVLHGDRKLLWPKFEIDVYIPDLLLGVEFNGDYWHSDKFMQINHGISAAEYHQRKYDACAKLGVELLFVWESDWRQVNEAVRTALLERLTGRSTASLLKKLSSTKL